MPHYTQCFNVIDYFHIDVAIRLSVNCIKESASCAQNGLWINNHRLS